LSDDTRERVKRHLTPEKLADVKKVEDIQKLDVKVIAAGTQDEIDAQKPYLSTAQLEALPAAQEARKLELQLAGDKRLAEGTPAQIAALSDDTRERVKRHLTPEKLADVKKVEDIQKLDVKVIAAGTQDEIDAQKPYLSTAQLEALPAAQEARKLELQLAGDKRLAEGTPAQIAELSDDTRERVK
ncbi:hypothetical protein OSJ77_20925, partial [Phyllobacterium sp. 0TCS1.6C]|uniref:hypothetical protein n=1 Tax=Phyllobacterium sp. 0TCS1.6C TaxID=2995638 RepID=UPI002264C4FA